MSWLTDLPLLLTRLTEIATLLREQNSLLRESILAQTKSPARTPLNQQTIKLRSSGQPQRLRTDKDVFVVTAADRVAIAEEERRRQTRQQSATSQSSVVEDGQPIPNELLDWHPELNPPSRK